MIHDYFRLFTTISDFYLLATVLTIQVTLQKNVVKYLGSNRIFLEFFGVIKNSILMTVMTMMNALFLDSNMFLVYNKCVYRTPCNTQYVGKYG